jgi:DNA (cytosine-5)-methyltransferase 1
VGLDADEHVGGAMTILVASPQWSQVLMLMNMKGPMNELALFAGAGGGILGGHLLGWRTVCAVEHDPYAASVLCARQNDGLLPPFPIWDDVRTFDGRPWRGLVDVVSGGFPCQDISAAGKGAGIDGERSGLWLEMARIIGEVRPRYAFVENSPVLTSRGLGIVLGDLAALGFDARWGVLGAADVGAPHLRKRIWIVAHSGSAGHGKDARSLCADAGKASEEPGGHQFVECRSKTVAHDHRMRELQQEGRKPDQRGWAGDGGKQIPDPDETGSQGRSELEQPPSAGQAPARIGHDPLRCGGEDWWQSEPDVGRVAHGVAARVDRLKAIGNGQVPLCAATAFTLLADD